MPTKILPRVIITYGACARGGGRRPGLEAIYKHVATTLRSGKSLDYVMRKVLNSTDFQLRWRKD